MILPEILEQSRVGDDARVRFVAPASLEYFAGHFPGFPVLPGVIQIGWVQHLAEKLFARRFTVTGMHRIKFMRIVRPGHEVTLELRLEGARINFRYSDAEGSCSSGTLDMETAA